MSKSRTFHVYAWNARDSFCCWGGKKDKFLFILRVSNFLSLRTSPLKWCGNPPVRKEMYRYLPNRAENMAFLMVIVTWYHSTGGLPRQCAHWLAMTAYIWCALSNNNLSVCPETFRTGKTITASRHLRIRICADEEGGLSRFPGGRRFRKVPARRPG